jgi:hypothetical protein
VIAADVFSALGVIPSLPGAACRGRHALHDPAAPGEDPAVVDQRQTQALALCSRCPALLACSEYMHALPKSKRPDGVVAGQLWDNGRPKSDRGPGRPRKAVS